MASIDYIDFFSGITLIALITSGISYLINKVIDDNNPDLSEEDDQPQSSAVDSIIFCDNQLDEDYFHPESNEDI